MDRAPKIRAYNMYFALKSMVDVKVVYFPTSTVLIRNKTIGYLTTIIGRIYHEISQLIRKEKFDYVYVEALASSLNTIDYALLNILRDRNIPIFPFIRDLYWKYPSTLKENSRRKKWFVNCEKEYNWYLKYATALLFPSEQMAATVNFPHKHVLQPAGDPTRCLKTELPFNKNITFVGGISSNTGLIELVEAMKKVTVRYPDAKLVIVGTGDTNIINKIKDEAFITVLSNLNYYEIPSILADSYITIIPRLKIQHNNFAMPVKLFDYMSCARPIIATNCETMAGFIEENKIGIIAEDNSESLAEKIIYLINNRSIAVEYGKNAYELIKNKHSWEKRAIELVKIMERY